MSPAHRHALQTLTRDECLALLEGSVSLGRIGYVVEGLPTILPVNFVLDEDDSVVFLTSEGTKLSWLANHSRVAFEVDRIHSADESGWSVLIHGRAEEITEPTAIRRLRPRLHSWAVSTTEHWVRIAIDDISGRRLGHEPPPGRQR